MKIELGGYGTDGSCVAFDTKTRKFVYQEYKFHPRYEMVETELSIADAVGHLFVLNWGQYAGKLYRNFWGWEEGEKIDKFLSFIFNYADRDLIIYAYDERSMRKLPILDCNKILRKEVAWENMRYIAANVDEYISQVKFLQNKIVGVIADYMKEFPKEVML